MARDLSELYVSDLKCILETSVYDACRIHEINAEDYKSIPDKTIEECKREFRQWTGMLIREGTGRSCIDKEIKRVVEEHYQSGLSADWTNEKAMERFHKTTLSVIDRLGGILGKGAKKLYYDTNASYVQEFIRAIASLVDAYYFHLRIEDIRANPSQPADFEYSSEPKTEAERKWRENIKKQCDLADKRLLENRISLMERIIDSSMQELDRNLKALDEIYASGNGGIEEPLKERTDSCREAILSADRFDPGQMKTVYDKALSEVKWLNQRLESLK